MVQKRSHVLLAKAHLKWTVFKVEKCSMVRRVQMWHSCGKLRTSCPPGQRRWRPSSVLSAFNSKASISDGIRAYGMGNLHVLEGTMIAERYIKVLEQHMLPFRLRLFQERPCVFQQDNTNHKLQLFQQHGFVVEESGCWIGLPAVQGSHL